MREGQSHAVRPITPFLDDMEHDLPSAILDVAGILTVVMDCSGRILLFNHACEQLTGWTFAELSGSRLWDAILLQEDARWAKDLFSHVNVHHFPCEHENYLLIKNGGRCWVHWKYSALSDGGGEVQYVIATGIDISDRKRMELALQEVHQLNQAILETAVDGIICIDSRGSIAVFNPAAEKIFGYRAEEVLGININILMPDPFNDEHDDYLGHYAETGIKRIIGIGREVVGRRKDGSLFPMDLAIGEILVPGKEVMFTGMVRDITDRKQAEQEAKRRLDELAQVSRLSLMGEMASGLAHEINQPLAAIVNYANACQRMLQSGHGATDVLLNTLTQIARQGQRAAEIVNHLRQFINCGETERTEANINSIISNVIDLLQHEIDAQQVTLQLRLDESLPEFAMDRIQIEQVILNLVKNAIDAMIPMPDDDRRLDIHTRRHGSTDDVVEVIVIDSGIGLPKDAADRVFDPLFTTKPNGIGVGLSISRSIVRSHGGRLWAAPDTLGGAQFHFTLPALFRS